MGRYITHDEEETKYWTSRKLAVRHIRLWARAHSVLDLYREVVPGKFGPGVRVESGFDLIRV